LLVLGHLGLINGTLSLVGAGLIQCQMRRAETILLDLAIEDAGLRQVQFLLPESLAQAQISVALLREKTVERAEAGSVRVTLQLQDELTGDLRVLVQDDRLLGGAEQQAPIPVVLTGRTLRRFVALENAGLDELVVERVEQLEALDRRQRQWQELAAVLGSGLTEAYLVSGAEPVLAYRTQAREAVEVAGARIGLGETLLALDGSGAYRATQVYHVDNRTAQFLEVELPAGSRLWAVRVADEPVKAAAAGTARRVRLPLLKTAPGELGYQVVLKYGGQIEAPGWVTRVEFPFVRTVNINVERSRARLFLPSSHAWLDFGGTMEPVTEAGAYEAGYLAYQTEKLKELVQTTRDRNEFAQVRAQWNVKQWQQKLDSHGGELRGRAVGQAAKELESQSRLLQQAAESPPPQAPGPLDEAVDNRLRLQRHFDEQEVGMAGGAALGLRLNFDQTVTENLRHAEPAEDRDRWAVTTESDAKSQKSEAIAGRKTGSRPEVRDQPEAPQMQERLDSAAGLFGQPAFEQRVAGPKATQNRLDSYRRRVESEKAAEPPAASTTPGKPAEVHEEAAPGVGGAGQADAERQPAALVSLDVPLPQRGVEYSFTTPRGEVRIHARALRRSTLQRLGTLLALAVGGLVLLGLARKARRQNAAVPAGRT
jgi:hypothetical protein